MYQNHVYCTITTAPQGLGEQFASMKGVNYSSRGPSVQSQAGVTSFTPGYAGIGLSFSVVQYSVNYVWGFKIQLNYSRCISDSVTLDQDPSVLLSDYCMPHTMKN